MKQKKIIYIALLLPFLLIHYSCAGKKEKKIPAAIEEPEDVFAVSEKTRELHEEIPQPPEDIYVPKETAPPVVEEIPSKIEKSIPTEDVFAVSEKTRDIPEEIPQPPEDIYVPSGKPATHIVEVKNNTDIFSPETLVINVGDTVKWINYDKSRDAHPFQSAPGTNPYDKDIDEIPLADLYSGATHEHTFNKIGHYPYFCVVHLGMKGEIIVVKNGQSIKEMEKEVAFLTKRKKKNIGGSRTKLEAKEMILIKAGKFIMGSPNEPTEGPVLMVNLPDFYIDKYEVTNEEYEEFIDATDYESNGTFHEGKISAAGFRYKEGRSTWRSAYRPGGEKYPVVNVSYKDATTYAKWAGKRLPTEAEWEKAARGTDKRLWPWGDEEDNEMTNVFGPDEYSNTAPVGLFEEDVSPYGVYDMAGNVSEWTSDKYLPYKGSSAPNYANFSPEKQVVRGGSFSVVDMNQARTHSRTGNKSLNFLPSVGFRLVKDK